MKKPLFKKMMVMLVSLGILFGLLIAWRFFVMGMISKVLSAPQPPAVVTTLILKTQTWQPYIQSNGSLIAEQSVDLMVESAGVITKMYDDKTQVKAGDPLLDLKDDVEQASLKSDKAKLVLAEANFKRYKKLYKDHFISDADYETASSNIEQDQAQVMQDQALIKQKHIKAPFDGMLGIWKVNLGEYIAPNSKAFVTLQQINPLLVEFSVDQKDATEIKIGQSVLFTVDSLPNQMFKGKVTVNNISFNADTHMLLMRAEIENSNNTLAPGQYGAVKILLPEIPNVLIIPQTAIEYNLYGDTVYVVQRDGDKLTVKKVFVKVGQRRGDEVIIQSGLKAGDEIVTTGQIKLYEGAVITTQ